MEIVCREQDRHAVRELFDCAVPVPAAATEYFLCFEAGALTLRRQGDGAGVWVKREDIRRRLTGPFLLGRACGLRPGSTAHILDATAGFGVDALALAGKGARVELVEREPLLWALLKDLLRRLDEPGIPLTLADLDTHLDGATAYDVIYLDPMFPDRAKTALPGKRMQYLSAMLAASAAFDMALIPKAQARARSRVVLKRRLKDPAELPPDWTLRGRSVRYDIYRGQAAR